MFNPRFKKALPYIATTVASGCAAMLYAPHEMDIILLVTLSFSLVIYLVTDVD